MRDPVLGKGTKEKESRYDDRSDNLKQGELQTFLTLIVSPVFTLACLTTLYSCKTRSISQLKSLIVRQNLKDHKLTSQNLGSKE